MGVVLEFLEAHKVSELPLHKGQIFEATTSMDLHTAFNLLVNNHVLSVPAYDEASKSYVGFLTVQDLVSFAVFATAENNAVRSLNDILHHGVARLGLAQDAVTVAYLARRNPFKPVHSDATLAAVCRLLGNGVHRIPLVDDSGRVINIISQSLLNDYLMDNLASLGTFGSRTVEELHIGTSPVLSIQENDSALNAFRTLERSGRSGIAVVSSSGRLQGVTSGSDLKLFLVNHESLNLSISDFLKSIRQADLKTRALAFICHPNDSIAKVMGMLKATRAHRLIVVDEHHHARKVVSILDILHCAIEH